MSFVVQYGPDPRTLGAYAYQSGAAPAIRENVQNSINNAQQAAQFNAQLRQHAIDRAIQQQTNQQNRAADIYQQELQNQGFERKNQYELLQNQADNEARLQQEQIQQQGMRARAYDESVQRGLKDGTLYHSPQQKQQLAEIQRNIASIYADNSIPPDQQDMMADRQYQKMRGIVPMVRAQDERPVPFHERAGQDIAVMNERGEVIPLSQLGRAPRNGETIITGTMRNGSMSYKTQPYKTDDQYSDFTSPVKLYAMRAKAANELQAELDIDYANRLAAWNDRKDQFDAANPDGDKHFSEPRPIRLRPSGPDIDARIYEMSGGVAGQSLQQASGGFWPGVAGAVSGLATRLSPGAPFANDPGRSPPVVVSSEAEALRQPPGTTVILNGRKFLVGE